MKKISLLLVGILLCVGCSPTTVLDKKQESILDTSNTAEPDSNEQKDKTEENSDNLQMEQQKEDTVQPEDTSSEEQIGYIVIEENKSETNIENMNLWKMDESIEDCKISVYTSAAIDSNGDILLDDNNEFLIVASIKDKEYTLLAREAIQLGVPEVSVYIDYEANEQINIILSDMRTAQCKINQYVYVDEELQCYELINKSGGNYIKVL